MGKYYLEGLNPTPMPLFRIQEPNEVLNSRLQEVVGEIDEVEYNM